MKTIDPEKELEQEVKAWAARNGIWVEVYDSKAKFTERGVYKTQGLGKGTPDLLGLNKRGRFIAIELKAPNKKAIPSLEQSMFLRRVIEFGGFGVVINDLNILQDMYSRWLMITDEINKRAYLLEKLPKKVIVKGKTLTIDQG